MTVIACGPGPISDSDRAKITAFHAALSQPTEQLTNLAILRMMADDGDEEVARVLGEKNLR